jgi:hypothetical protein
MMCVEVKFYGGSMRHQSSFSTNIPKQIARHEWRKLLKTSLLAAAFCFVGSAAHAQFRTSIQGSITDPEGAVIPGAKLTLLDKANNATQVRTSDDSGIYNFNALPPDQFKLTVEKAGFQTQVLDNVRLTPEQPNDIGVKLQLGSVDTSVTVDASTVSAMDTDTANIGGTITANDIQHMPSFNRDVFTLSQLAPGAISDGSQVAGGGVYNRPGNQGPGGSGNAGAAPTENGPQVNANGGQYENNSITLDGISIVSAVWGGTSIITPSEEAIDNVRIVTNAYDAEYGRFSGSQTLVTTKSGTNQFHGSAFFAMHRPGLNSNNRVVRDSTGAAIGATQKDTQRYNQYGGSLGGPIWKDKLFAFFAYETTPNSSTSPSKGWYETNSLRSAAPSGSISSTFLNFPGSAPSGTIVTANETCALVGLQEGKNCATIAGQGLDIGSPLKNGLGKQDPTTDGTPSNPGIGGGLDGVADVAFYQISVPSTSYYHQFVGRMDGQVKQNDHLAFSIYWVPQGNTTYAGSPRAYNLFHHEQINQATSVIWNHTFSPNFLNEARANAAGWRWNEVNSNPQQPVGLPQDTVTFAPTASTSTGTTTSLGTFGSSVGSHLDQWTYSYKDVATKVIGQHTIKFGGEYTNLHYLQDPQGQPSYAFYGLWSFLNDAPYQEKGNFNSVTGKPGGVRSDQRENLFGGFIQDDWKATPNLTLHVGLRYSYFGALFSKQNNIPAVMFGQGAAQYTGITVHPTDGLWTPQKGNFGPQFSFNWSPAGTNGKMVVRGGYGISYNQNEIAITSNASFNPPTSNNDTFTFDSPASPGVNGGKILYGVSSDVHTTTGYAVNPNTITTYNAAGLPVAGSANLTIAGDGYGHAPTVYFHHFSLDSEYQLTKWLVATAGYQGSLGRHLIAHETPNAPAAVQGIAFNQLVTGGDFWRNEGSSNNNAFLASLKHPMTHGLSAEAQFMWSKSMDVDGSGPYEEDPYYPLGSQYAYARSDFNVGKSVKVFGLWQPTFFHGDKRWVEKVAGGWSLSGIFNFHTGFPYSAVYNLPNSLYCNQCGYTQVRAQYLGGANGNHSNEAFINNTNFANQKSVQTMAIAPVNISPNSCAVPNPPSACATTVAYGNKYFNVANFYNQVEFANTAANVKPTLALPNTPGSARNIFDGPNYRDVDASLSKGFGLPNMRFLGDNARLEIRADVFNLFNILNLNPGSVGTVVDSGTFGQDTTALSGRTISFQGRFSF